MNRQAFEEGFKELDQEFEARAADFAAPAPNPAKHTARAPLFRRAFVLMMAAAAVVVVLVWRWPAASLGGFVVQQRDEQFEATVSSKGLVQVARGAVMLSDLVGQATLQLEAGAAVERVEAGARVQLGLVRFEVAHEGRRSRPYVVQVSGGLIEVMGTSFTVVQHEAGGQVTLHRGAIRFRAVDGRVVLMSPGDSVTWPLLAVTETPSQRRPSAPTPALPPRTRRVEPEVDRSDGGLASAQPEPAPAKPPFSVEAVLHRVALLRSRGAFNEAAAELTRALPSAPNDATRERLGFELGSILSYHSTDTHLACEHWARFALDHPSGRYAPEVAAAVEALQCPTSETKRAPGNSGAGGG